MVLNKKVIFINTILMLMFFLNGCIVNEATREFDEAKDAAYNIMLHSVPDEYADSHVFNLTPGKYFDTVYDIIHLGENFAVLPATTEDNCLWITDAYKKENGKYYSNRVPISVDLPLSDDLYDNMHTYRDEKVDEYYVYGYHNRNENAIYINGVEAITEDVVIECNDVEYELAFTYIVLPGEEAGYLLKIDY